MTLKPDSKIFLKDGTMINLDASPIITPLLYRPSHIEPDIIVFDIGECLIRESEHIFKVVDHLAYYGWKGNYRYLSREEAVNYGLINE